VTEGKRKRRERERERQREKGEIYVGTLFLSKCTQGRRK
jgi:hypothetical protein